MVKQAFMFVGVLLAGALSGMAVTRYDSPAARERRAIAALCDDGAAVYLRCDDDGGGGCRAAAPGSGVVPVDAGKIYRIALGGASIAWQLTKTSTAGTTND